MFYDNTEYQLARFHHNNNNNNALIVNNHEIIHLVLIGDKNIGKSKLIKRFRCNEKQFHLAFHPIDLIYDKIISITSPIDCLLLLFDISNQISFDHLIDRCLVLIQTYSSVCSFIGIRNNHLRQMTSEQIHPLMKKWKVHYYEITWKCADDEILAEILENYYRRKSSDRSLFSRIFHW